MLLESNIFAISNIINVATIKNIRDINTIRYDLEMNTFL